MIKQANLALKNWFTLTLLGQQRAIMIAED